MPVEPIRVRGHGHVRDLDPGSGLEMLETPPDQRRPVPNGADENSEAYQIVAFFFILSTGERPRFLNVGGRQCQVLEPEVVWWGGNVYAEDVGLWEA